MDIAGAQKYLEHLEITMDEVELRQLAKHLQESPAPVDAGLVEKAIERGERRVRELGFEPDPEMGDVRREVAIAVLQVAAVDRDAKWEQAIIDELHEQSAKPLSYCLTVIKGCRARMTAPTKTLEENTFIALWDKAVGTPGYDKAQWIKLQREMVTLKQGAQ